MTASAFSGAKLALICEDALLVYLRDDRDDIPFPGKWDFPGGGREGDERPEHCAVRELKEEFGLDFDTGEIIWSRRYESWHGGDADSYFFVARISKDEISKVQFGDEGQYWRLMPITEYLSSPDAINHLSDRLLDFLADG
ncbi:MAG: NUDIX hydrolase [Pseudomonadota bacterium]